MKPRGFFRYATAVLGYTLLVIAWGALVRATRSGAGCGSHWPMCNGQVVPGLQSVATLIEFTHRMMSGSSFLLVVGLTVWAFRAFDRRHPVRRGAALALGFMLTESLLGAGLVLLRHVNGDTSIARVWYLAAHLVNTFLLLASLALTAWWSRGDGPGVVPQAGGGVATALGAGIVGTLLLGVSGGIAALGDTLFPVRSLAEGFAQDASPTAHVLLRLRLLHPVLALGVGAYLVAVAWGVRSVRRSAWTTRFATALTVLFVTQLGLGIANVYLLTPVWMQLVHLFVADLVWISLVLLAGAAREAPPTPLAAAPVTARV